MKKTNDSQLYYKRNNHKTTKGFTLIELIIVIAILAILAAIAIPAYNGLRAATQKSVCESNRDSFMRQYMAASVVVPFEVEHDTLVKAVGGIYSEAIDLKADTLCPVGTDNIVVIGSELKCTEHDPESMNAKLQENYSYTASAYNENTTYKIGDLVERDGIIYRKVYPNGASSTDADEDKKLTDADGYLSWMIVGTSNGSAVNLDTLTNQQKYSLALGTTVKSGGKYYMYAQTYGDNRPQYSPITNSPNFSNGNWIDVTNNPTEYTKPTREENGQSNAYYTYSTYKTGDVVWHQGKLYKAKADIPQNTYPQSSTDFWELVE